MGYLDSILYHPAIVVKNAAGKTFVPDEISARLEVWCKGALRLSGRVKVDNTNGMIEQAREYIPEHNRKYIQCAEIRPAINPPPGGMLAKIRFDCNKWDEIKNER